MLERQNCSLQNENIKSSPGIASFAFVDINCRLGIKTATGILEFFNDFVKRQFLIKFLFTIIYRSPSENHEEFDIFLINFDLMLSKMFVENPYAVIISGDFNCRSTQWWDKENENEEGRSFEPLLSDLGLHQLMNEPTHVIGEHRSCIDLVLTNQPNIFLEAGVHPSLHEFCHHQIVYGN